MKEKIDRIIFPVLFIFCELKIFLLASVLNIIIGSVVRKVNEKWVGGSLSK